MSTETWYQTEALSSFPKSVIPPTWCLGLNLEYTFEIQRFAINYKHYIINLCEVLEIILNNLRNRMKRSDQFPPHLITCRELTWED